MRALRKITFALAVLALGAWGVYVVAGNALLAAGGVQKMFEATDTVKFDFDSARTWWPGVVHVNGARVVFQDRNLQWFLGLDHAVVTIRLTELAKRTFHATKVRGDGVVFRMRHRVRPEVAQEPWVTTLPPIAGFYDPAVFEATVPPPPLTEANYNLWTVFMEDVDVGATEIWAQQFRYTGEARVIGQFRLRPARRLWVGPASLELHPGSLTVGADEAMHGLEGTLTCTVDPFDVQPVAGMGPFRFITAHAKLMGQVTSLAFLDVILGNDPPFSAEDGSGSLKLDVAIDHGIFTPESSLLYEGDHAQVRAGEIIAHLDDHYRLALRAHELGTSPQATFALSKARVDRVGHPVAPLKIENTAAQVETTTNDVTAEWHLKDGRVDVGSACLTDVRWLATASSSALRPEGGAACAAGTTTWVSSGEATGAWKLTGQKLRGAAGTSHLEVEKLVTQLDFEADHLDRKTGHVHLQGALADALMIAGATATAAHGVKFDTRVEFHEGKHFPVAYRGHADGVARDGVRKPAAEPRDGRGHATATIHLTGVQTHDLGRDPGCSVSGADEITFDGQLDFNRKGPGQGALRVDVNGVSAHWGEFSVTADNAIGTVRATGADPLTLARSLDARLQFGEATLHSGEGAPKNWDAKIHALTMETALAIDGNGKANGPLHVSTLGAHAGLGHMTVVADVDAKLKVLDLDVATSQLDLTGGVRTTNVALQLGDRRLEKWWSVIDVSRVHLDASRNLDVQGGVLARFRDGVPALALFGDGGGLPSWVPSVLPLNDLQFEAQVERHCQWTSVSVRHAHGGPLLAEGGVQMHADDLKADFLVSLGAFKPLAVGLATDADQLHISPLVGQGWLAEHLDSLQKTTLTRRAETCSPPPKTCR